MGREEKRREVDGAAVEGGDSKPVSKFFFVGEDHIFNFLTIFSIFLRYSPHLFNVGKGVLDEKGIGGTCVQFRVYLRKQYPSD